MHLPMESELDKESDIVVQFSLLKEEHLPAVLCIYNHYVTSTTVSFDIDPIDLDKLRAMTLHGQQRYPSYVMMDGAEVIGYVLLSPFIKKHGCDQTAEVSVYLQSQFSGKGIGKQALRFIEEVAKEQGLHTLIAVICTENVASLHLFQRQGYSNKGTLHEVAYKFTRYLDVTYMQKLL